MGLYIPDNGARSIEPSSPTPKAAAEMEMVQGAFQVSRAGIAGAVVHARSSNGYVCMRDIELQFNLWQHNN
ncbi:hypothetical protein PXNS11_70011 [Stutzerimonas xanthomarina]|nr:hypothetical protein PXNS11_70011 [Stutzerimonas xanthomarina]